LDGTDDFVSIPASSANGFPGKNTAQWTVEFWAKRSSTSTRDYIIGQAGGNADNKQLVITFSEGTNFTFDFWDNRIQYDYGTEDNQWHHWACVFNNSLPNGQTNRWIYRDGVLVGSDESINYGGDGTIYIGELPQFNGRNFEGYIDELRFFNIARTQASIMADKNRVLPSNTANLVAYYNFDNETVGNAVMDKTGNGHNGTSGGTGGANNLPQYSLDIPPIEQITFGATGTFSTTEAGTSVNFEVKVNQAPTHDIVIGISSSDTGEGVSNKTSLTFTPSNWNMPQTFTVTGVADNMIDGNQNYTIISAAVTSQDNNFNGFNPRDISMVNLDIDGKQRSLCFNGTNEYLLLPEAIGNIFSNEFTLQFWAKRDGTEKGDLIITQEGNAQDNSKLVIGFREGTVFTFDFWGNRITYDYGTEDNEWHHWACVFNTNLNGQTNRWLYRDGQLVGSNDGGDYLGSGKVWLGGDNANGTRFFDGKLDDIRLYNTARNQGQIQGDMNTQLNGNNANLQFYLPINNEDCLVDYSNNHYPVEVRGYTNNLPVLGLDYRMTTEVNPTTFSNNQPCTGVKFSKTSLELSEGNMMEINAQLTVAPTANVSFNLSSSNMSEVTISPTTLNFTPQDWNMPKTITVTAVENSSIAPDFTFDMITAPITSSDAAYQGLNPVNILVRKYENDCLMNSANQDRTSARQDYINNYMGSSWSYGSLNWTGSVNGCNAGTFSSTIKDQMLQRLNYYRRLAGCNNDLTTSTGKDNWAQHAALIMQANNFLNHSPPSNSTCFTSEGGTGAAGNLSVHNQTINPIDQWMDDANQGNLGHRRWGIFSQASSVGHGVTSNYACQYIRSDNASNGYSHFIAYPAAGYMPRNLIYAEWNFSVPNATFSNADVKIYGPNGPISIEIISKTAQGYGDNAIIFRPLNNSINTSSTADVFYDVIISGVQNAAQSNYCYRVIVYDPNTIINPNACNGTIINISSNPTDGSTTKASQSITTSGSVVVPNGQSATFRAKQSITLANGFHAQGTFHALIGDCDEASIISNTPETSYVSEVYRAPSIKAENAFDLKIIPNPFQYSAQIRYELPTSGPVNLIIYNMQGKIVKRLLNQNHQEAGAQQITFNAMDLESGIYFVGLSTENEFITEKMMLLKD
jgi:hypothetical protein